MVISKYSDGAVLIEALRLRADCLYAQHQWKDALRDYESAGRAGNATAGLLFAKGLCERGPGNLDAAVSEFMAALAINPEIAQAYEMLHEIHTKLAEDHNEKAQWCLRKRKNIVDPEDKYQQLPLFLS